MCRAIMEDDVENYESLMEKVSVQLSQEEKKKLTGK